MSINKLPNECLYMILDHFNGFEELIRLSKVSPRWFSVVLMKFSKVKYLQLIGNRQRDSDYIENDKLWKNTRETLKSHNLKDLFPNLKIMEVPESVFLCLESYDFRRLIHENPKIKGLIRLYQPVENRYNLKNIEMVSFDCKCEFKKVFRPDQLKQIHFDKLLDYTELSQVIEYFPNLKRLNLALRYDTKKYDGPNLAALKIFEVAVVTHSYDEFSVFRFMDSCPNLESVFLHYIYGEDASVNDSIKNFNLRDLVIEQAHHLKWSSLRKILSKFSNLHHLGIRNNKNIDDSHVGELVKLLPKIKLIDLRRCDEVTQKSADILSKYCEKSNRSIKIYYGCDRLANRLTKSTFRYEKICSGFDSMKNCFLKSWSILPDLLDED
ncbi:uncharacterized protein LOC128389089 [Panonychus citri]|uniref:uncharacterized protein LOC128389089 n=1 Tax=Panonychus citri TaxID=50023 RepID=UPI0023075E02|nr:uncharacterized protein LOC128389089 [Panonychus citri]